MERDAYVVCDSRLRLGGILAWAVVFVVGCLAGLGVLGEKFVANEPDDIGRAVLWGGAVFFSIAGLLNLRRFLRAGETYLFDSLGVTIGGKSFIPWDHILSAKTWTQKIRSGSLIPVRQHFLVFDVDPDYEDELPKVEVWLRDLNYDYTEGSHAITAIGSNRSLEEIVEGFNRFAPSDLRVTLD